jgi:tripeptide aminopeptidase
MINEQRLVDTFLKLVHINSPSRHEGEAMDAAEAILQRLGFSTERDDAGEKLGGDTGNLIAHRAGTTGAPPVFFNAHIDTVQPTPNIQVIQEGGVIRTDGTTILGADDKAGVATILEAAESMVESGEPMGDLTVIITICEEVGLLGAQAFDHGRVAARSGWVVDSGQPLSAIGTAAPSQDHVRAVITGRAAHAGARPEAGISAITVAAKAIAAMPQGRIDEETTANVGMIHGGLATNIVPPECIVTAEARSHDPVKLAAQVEAMTAAFTEAACAVDAHVTVSVEPVFRAFHIADEAREVRIAMAAMRDLGLSPSTERSGGGYDANFFNQGGMACCVLGSGYRDIHTVNENIAVADLVMGARIVEAVMKRAFAEA